MTLALAIWGAATGTIVMLVEVVKHVLDRPRLVVGLHMTRSVNMPPELGINVTNKGRRPTTIMKAAFAADSEAEIRSPADGALVATGAIELTLSEDPTVIAANGGVAQFRAFLGEWPGPFHADEPLRPYVIDSHSNRPTYGPAAPVLRVFLNSRWEPADAPPEALVPAEGGPVRARPVVPRWKLWKPAELRKPSLPPPQAWPPRRDAETKSDAA